MILMGLGSVRSSFSTAELAGAIAKIKGLVPEAERKAIELKAGQISIDLTPWGAGGPGMAALGLIQQALKENRLLHFDYMDRKGQATTRRVEPYRLILKKNSWYFGGFCLVRQALRLFKVTRMLDTTLEENIFVPRSVDADSFIVINFDDAECIEGLLRVNSSARETILELFGDSVLEYESESTWLARITLTDNEQCYSFIAGLGSGAEVLEPLHFRIKMQQYFQNAINLYV